MNTQRILRGVRVTTSTKIRAQQRVQISRFYALDSKAVAEMITKYRNAPRALIQRELMNMGISNENAQKYAELLEDVGLDPEKLELILSRMKVDKYPKHV